MQQYIYRNVRPGTGSFQDAVRLDPANGDARALKALGTMYLKVGKREKSKTAFQAAHQVDPQLNESVVLSSRLIPESERKVPAKRKKATVSYEDSR